jgi:hypothetical protein
LTVSSTGAAFVVPEAISRAMDPIVAALRGPAIGARVRLIGADDQPSGGGLRLRSCLPWT